MDYNTKRRTKLAIIPLIFAAVILVSGTYAWFVYFSNVQTSMTGHVVGWNIEFDGDNDVDQEVTFQVQKIYPGMDDFEGAMTITNSGDASADIGSVLKSVTIFGETYSVGDLLDGERVNSAGLVEYLNKHFPFKFNFVVDKPVIAKGETANFSAGVTWAYETYIKVDASDTFNPDYEYYTLDGEDYTIDELVDAETFNTKKDILYYVNDIEDTRWGEEAIDYIAENPGDPCITLVLSVTATQHVD